jgi:hypothetical protein
MIVELLLFVCIVLLIVTLAYTFFGGKPAYMGPKPFYNLSTEGQVVLQNTDFSWSAQACAIRFALFVETAPRVLTDVKCGADDETLFQPTCPTFEFNPCSCEAMFCDRCKMKESYLHKMLHIGDSMELYMAGYSPSVSESFIPAILKIRTGKDSTQHYMESVSLPAIPFQKWNIITIVKEGRRFDVYYGAELVVTKLLDHIPISPDSSQGWYAGNMQWNGTIGLFYGVVQEQSSYDVERDVSNIVDRRGIPFYITTPPLSIPSLSSLRNFSFTGASKSLPIVAPANPFLTYQTNLA